MWERLSKFIAKYNMPAPAVGMFYQAAVMATLLYCCASWVLSPSRFWVVEGFHVECAQRLTGMRPEKVKGKWVYPT